MSALDQTVAAQRRAARPDSSAWVSANAGSGKTRVLTDRVVRLMLAGTPPDRILSLTFTKAAAAEMSNRLFERLGHWAAMPDEALRARLDELLGPKTAADVDLIGARRLFARALETPGGLKIQTIHAFAEAVLGRFPVEAGISPEFEVLDETAAAELLRELKDRLITGESGEPAVDAAVDRLVERMADTTFDDLLAAAIGARARIEAALAQHRGAGGLIRAIRRALGLEADETEADVLAAACAFGSYDELGLRRAIEALRCDGGKRALERADILAAWVGADDAGRQAMFGAYLGLFVTTQDEPRKNLLPAKAERDDPAAAEHLLTEQARVMELNDRRRAAALAELTGDLMLIAGRLLGNYARAKAHRAVLDYDDLILRTRDLLERDAGWVLFKLDQGIDHILIDEAQDTSPEQWRIVELLSDEFFAGDGARPALRTVFAVGDEKQSIYSFQGADPDGFHRMQSHFRGKAAEVGGAFESVALELSFRSAPEILAAVDGVFRNEQASGLTAEGGPTHHQANRAAARGRVELWPLVEPSERAEANRWEAPLDREPEDSPRRRLAQQIAERIRRMLDEHETVGDPGSAERPLKRIGPGDVMVLVRRREPIVDEIARALKDRGIPVAGADRMRLTEQIAVMDLMVLGDFLLLPEDDLALATVLKSPLFNLDDDDLFALAYGRKGHLWTVLKARADERPAWRAAVDELRELMARVDRLTPFAFFTDLLGPRGGRRRLIARLGPDQLDPLDEFLEAAIADERNGPPSMQGFLHRVRRRDAVIKRDMDHGGEAVRIMTVHGAKGLEAPVVFLPDTCRPPRGPDGPLTALETARERLPVINLSQREMPDRAAQQRAADREAMLAEYRRLLYVAMTRAEDRLYVAGYFASRRSVPGDECWYRLVEAGLAGLGAEADADGVRRLGAPATAAELPPVTASPAPVLPAWALTPLPAEPSPPRPLSPSRAVGAEPPVSSPLQRDPAFGRRRGTLVHHLLQVLPTRPAEGRAAAGARLLERLAADLSEDRRQELLDEALAVMAAPALAPLFGPESRAEAAITGLVGRIAVTGRVDRLAVEDDRVLLIDYKTNRPAPATVDAVPAAYVGQMALYRAVLSEIYPGREIVAVLVWTDEARAMTLPQALLDDALGSLDALSAGS